jgi:hypothetical protein
MSTLDVSPAGRLLVGDVNAREVRLYEPTGTHIRRLDVEQCAPGLDPPTIGTFVFGEQIVAYNGNAAFLFDPDGSCAKRIDEPGTAAMSLCSTADTLYAFYRRRPSRMKLFSKDLELIREYELPAPRFPTVVSVSGGLRGRDIACTDDEVTYLYTDEPDVAVLHGPHDRVRHEPANYTRPASFPDNHKNTSELSDNLRELRSISDLSIGAFELGNGYRIVALENWRREPRRPSFPIVLNVISRTEPERSYSMVTDKWPFAARNGTLYVRDLTSMGAANVTIEKYRLKPSDGQ